MDTAIARPHFELSDLQPRPEWILEEIEDINGDARSARCNSCFAPLSWGQWFSMNGDGALISCHSCGELLLETPDCGEVTPEQAAEVLSESYLDRVWYHATTDPDWLNTVQKAGHGDLLVHVGDRLSALSRADWLGLSKSPKAKLGRKVYLYSFRIYIPDYIVPAIGQDMGCSWQQTIGRPIQMERAKLQGEERSDDYLTISDNDPLMVYYNRFEIPGAFSLLLAAGLIEGESLTVESRQY